MGSRMLKSCVKAETSDSHSEDRGSNPRGAATLKKVTIFMVTFFNCITFFQQVGMNKAASGRSPG